MESYELPKVIPAMELPKTTFFPQSILPLYIFEPKYREMLSDTLEHERLFTVIEPLQDSDENGLGVTILGYVKACQTNPDGTSMILVEGIKRVEILKRIYSKTYPQVEVGYLHNPEIDTDQIREARTKTIELLKKASSFELLKAEDKLDQIMTIEDPQLFLDHAIAGLLDSPEKQCEILKIVDPLERFEKFQSSLETLIEKIELLEKVKGNMTVEQIRLN